jgi:hypothetical protein
MSRENAKARNSLKLEKGKFSINTRNIDWVLTKWLKW